MQEDPDATQAEVDASTEAVNAAVAALEEKPDEPPAVNKDDLKETVETAEQLDNSAYTDESVAVLAKAIEEAKKVLADETATQAQVDAAEQALNAAVAAGIMMYDLTRGI